MSEQAVQRGSLRTVWMLLAVLLVVLAAPLLPRTHRPTPVASAAGPTLNGGGSSFAKLEIDQWRAEIARNPYNINVNYVAQGSSFGRQQYISGNLDFAASDIPFTPPELDALNGTARRDFVYVPVSAGGLGIMFNLIDKSGNRVTALNLTRRAVCRIFTEANMLWSDPEIQNQNTAIALPDEYIRPIVRSDGSGTSYVLSEFCLTVVPDVWAAFVSSRKAVDPGLDPAFVAGDPTSNWPQGWGKSASALAADGVAAAVADSSGLYSVTYNEAGFAKVRGFPNASLENGAGVFTQPTEDAVSIALGYASGRPNGTFQLNYTGPDPGAYYPSTYSYVIAQTTGFAADKGEVLARFLCYSITKGQRVDLTSKLGYARLSAPLVDLGRAAIAKIPGAPPWDQCKVDSAAPPPAATTLPPTVTTVKPATGGATTVPAATGTGATGATAPPQTSIVIDPSTGSSVVVTVASSGAAPGTGSAGSTGNASTGSGSATPSVGGSSGVPSQTVVSIDPVTGESVVVPVADGECIDPVSGLPADPTTCVGSEAPIADAGTADGAAPAVVVAAGAPTVGAPAPANPRVDASGSGPSGTQIAWWLVQGASVCALGAALSGVRRRGA